MKFKGLCTLSVLLVTSLNFISGHSYHLDQHPDFEPLPDFVMERFLGRWYAVQMTALSNRCMIFDFASQQEPNNVSCINCRNCVDCVNCRDCSNCVGCTSCLNCNNCNTCVSCDSCSSCNTCTSCTGIRNCNNCVSCTTCNNSNELEHNISENSTTGEDKYSNYRYTVQLKADSILPSSMTVTFPQRKSSLVVFATDYENYAGVHSSQKIPYGHRHSVTILSRSKVLNKTHLDQLRNRIMSVRPHELSTVDQEKCKDNITFITYSVE
ncbi:uncharacterized protein LOC126843429 [Adelges cooleyi]|uniref:uncharacterized protein LOC126843429 n=1 Tax=Adelges cooleyi TaxID=133065 RepID=UPI00217F5C22|nr:uncharacterized protein LOC126843429 [Adelges cooleyi]